MVIERNEPPGLPAPPLRTQRNQIAADYGGEKGGDNSHSTPMYAP